MTRFRAILLGVVLVASVAIDVLGPSKEPEHIWDLKMFFAIYGFVGCVAIIFISKAVGKYWLQREPGYYSTHRAPDEVIDGAEYGEERDDA
jgi:hypothetical protein